MCTLSLSRHHCLRFGWLQGQWINLLLGWYPDFPPQQCLAGKVPPDAGTVELGPTVKLGLVSQLRDELDDNKTVYQEIAQSEDFITVRLCSHTPHRRQRQGVRCFRPFPKLVSAQQVGDHTINTRAYMAAFNLKGAMQEKRVGDLSGGERNRVHLAKVMKGRCVPSAAGDGWVDVVGRCRVLRLEKCPSSACLSVCLSVDENRNNVIFLDEPSNDLDVETLRALVRACVYSEPSDQRETSINPSIDACTSNTQQEAALRDFPGCAVVISHDRWMLDRICTHTLAFEADGGAGPSQVTMFPGNYSDYVAYRRAEQGTASKK